MRGRSSRTLQAWCRVLARAACGVRSDDGALRVDGLGGPEIWIEAMTMPNLPTAIIYALAALAEIAGCFTFWACWTARAKGIFF